MTKLLTPLLCLFLLLGCGSSRMGDNPTADAQEMMYSAMTLLKDGKGAEADELIGRYLSYYKTADKTAQTEFCRASTETHWQRMFQSGDPVWKPFLEKMRPLMQWYMESPEALSSLPNFRELRKLQTGTLSD